MMAGGGEAAMDHNGIYSTANLHDLPHNPQQSHMEADNSDSRKRPLETPAEEAGCTKRTNTGGKGDPINKQLLLSRFFHHTHIGANAFAVTCGTRI